jgi:hypothetical protein
MREARLRRRRAADGVVDEYALEDGGVAADAAVERVVAAAAVEGVVAVEADEEVGPGVAGEGVGERVAGDIDGEAVARRGDDGLFDVRRQRVAGGAGEGDPDEIEAFANGFRDDVAGDVDLVLVVAAAADERVAAGAADQRVVAGETAEDVGCGVAGEAVVEFVADDVDGDRRRR